MSTHTPLIQRLFFSFTFCSCYWFSPPNEFGSNNFSLIRLQTFLLRGFRCCHIYLPFNPRHDVTLVFFGSILLLATQPQKQAVLCSFSSVILSCNSQINYTYNFHPHSNMLLMTRIISNLLLVHNISRKQNQWVRDSQ